MRRKPRRNKRKIGHAGSANDLTPGTILKDYSGQEWTIGTLFARGGCGTLYTGRKHCVTQAACDYIIKMEPATNGTLFQESVVFERILKKSLIEDWQRGKKLLFLGVPTFVASGKHFINGRLHRFLIQPQYGVSLESLRQNRPNRRLGVSEAIAAAKGCLDSLEYLHGKGYAHGDVKAENLLLKPDCANPAECYLIDFGLATRTSHVCPLVPVSKMAHEGTLQFTSLDAHSGFPPTKRGDVEILGYNFILWLNGTLPWAETCSPVAVMEQKTKFLENCKSALKEQFRNSQISGNLAEYFELVFNLHLTEEVPFERLRDILDELKSMEPETSSSRTQRLTGETSSSQKRKLPTETSQNAKRKRKH